MWKTEEGSNHINGILFSSFPSHFVFTGRKFLVSSLTLTTYMVLWLLLKFLCFLSAQVFSGRLLTLIDHVYRCLPLGTIIDGRVLVVHGGVSEHTDLRLISDIDRQKVGVNFALNYRTTSYVKYL